MLQKTLKTLTLFALAACAAIGADAQTYRLPNAHKAEHNDLIARQENIGNQISVKDTQDFLDNLFKDEEEPELDIYTEGWNSRSVRNSPPAPNVLPMGSVSHVGMKIPIGSNKRGVK